MCHGRGKFCLDISNAMLLFSTHCLISNCLSGVEFNSHLKSKAWVKNEVKDAFRKALDREMVKAWVKAWVKAVQNVY